MYKSKVRYIKIRGPLTMYSEQLCSEGFDHNPLWKPLYWMIYWSYIPLEDFQNGYPQIAKALEDSKEVRTKHYLYKNRGKTRKMVIRIHLNHIHLADRSLYEKTPSEKKVKENHYAELH